MAQTTRAARRVWAVSSPVECDYCKVQNAVWRAGFDRPVIYICKDCYYDVLLRLLRKNGPD